MYKNEFDALKQIPNNVLFFGSHFYLMEYEKKILSKFKDANILKFYFDEFDFDLAKIHLMESSLFGDTNVLIIKHDKFLDVEKLIQVNKNNYFFYFYYGDKNPLKNKNPFKDYVRFFEPKLKDIVLFIEEKSKELNIKISQEAKLFLAKSVSAEFLEKEIEKLSLFSVDLNLEDVKKLVFFYKEESFEDLIVSILKGEDFYEKLENILQTQDKRRIIPSIIKYVRELYEYNLYFKKTGSSSLEGFLGYKLPYDIEKQRIELSLKFKEKDYYELLKNLLEFELKMRNSEKNKDAIFWEAMSFLKIFNSF